MQQQDPIITLLAKPQLQPAGVAAFLKTAGAPNWQAEPNSTDAEALIEMAGRACYRSWEPGLNPNVTKVRTDGYLQNVIKQGHGSVLEHAQFTFGFQSVSRVFTHELVRHRAGVAISQESLRYVRLTDLTFNIPDVLKQVPDGKSFDEHRKFVVGLIEMVETLEDWQQSAADHFGFDDDDNPMPFAQKKVLTSALRRLAPMGLSTSMIWSANVRTLRHVIEMRTSVHAEAEIREVFDKVAFIMKAVAPRLFADFVRDDDGAWTTPHSKV